MASVVVRQTPPDTLQRACPAARSAPRSVTRCSRLTCQPRPCDARRGRPSPTGDSSPSSGGHSPYILPPREHRVQSVLAPRECSSPAASPRATSTRATSSATSASRRAPSRCSASAATGSQAEGGRLLAHVRDLAVVGLLEVLRHLRRLRAVFRSVLDEVDRERPAVAVLVDYADFNLRLARELKRRGVPVVYYVSPQVWAWRRGTDAGDPRERRAHDRDLPLRGAALPRGGRAGRRSWATRSSTSRGPRRTAPRSSPRRGSTPRGRCWPCCPAAGGRRWRTTSRRSRARCACSARAAPTCSSPSPWPRASTRGLFDRELAGLPVARVAGHTHALLSAASAGIVASGTATVEAALMDLPMVVVYRLSPLTYALGPALRAACRTTRWPT